MCGLIDNWALAGDERRTTNDERRTTNDERRTAERTVDDGRRTTDDGRRTTDDGVERQELRQRRQRDDATAAMVASGDVAVPIVTLPLPCCGCAYSIASSVTA